MGGRNVDALRFGDFALRMFPGMDFRMVDFAACPDNYFSDNRKFKKTLRNGPLP